MKFTVHSRTWIHALTFANFQGATPFSVMTDNTEGILEIFFHDLKDLNILNVLSSVLIHFQKHGYYLFSHSLE